MSCYQLQVLLAMLVLMGALDFSLLFIEKDLRVFAWAIGAVIHAKLSFFFAHALGFLFSWKRTDPACLLACVGTAANDQIAKMCGTPSVREQASQSFSESRGPSGSVRGHIHAKLLSSFVRHPAGAKYQRGFLFRRHIEGLILS